MRWRSGFGSMAASLFVGGLIALSVTGNTGCSVIFKDSAEQCTSDGDCRAKGLVGSICSPDKVCLAGCASHDQCTTENGGRAALCGTNSKCAPLEIDGCSLARDQQGALSPTYKDPNAVFIGELSARTSTQIPGNDAANQFILADEEIRNVQAQGLPGGPGGARRPLVRITCETGDDSDRMNAYAKHLVDVVNAPIVISTWNNHAIRVHEAVTKSQKSVFEYCVACSADIRRFSAGSGDVSTIFSGTAAAVDLAAGIVAKVADIENKVRAKEGFSGNVRLALLVTTGLEGAPPEQTAEEVLKTLRFNGKLASENGTDYQFFPYSASSDRAAVASQLAAFAPHIIIPITLAEANRSIFPLVESNWPAGAMRAEYIGNVGQQQVSMLELVQANEDLRKRNVIVNFTPAPTDLDKFNVWKEKYQQRFGAAPGLAPFAYDGYYGIAYATVASGASGKLTGGDIVKGLLNLNSNAGTAFFVGTVDLVSGMNQALKGPIELSGLVVPFNFNADTGRTPFTRIPIFCMGRPPSGSVTFSPTGQFYSVASQKLEGTYTCPGG